MAFDPRSVAMPKKNHGYSLAELAVALVILGVALAVTIPPFQRSLNRAQLDRVPAELQSDLRLAISNAKATGRTVRLSFGSNGYEVMDAVDSTSIRKRDFQDGVYLASTGDPLIFPWGLVQPAEINVSGHNSSKTFRILPTGRIEVEANGGEQ
jgi:prepilin-type N-terminal cleavage/methylation domain-containing protein